MDYQKTYGWLDTQEQQEQPAHSDSRRDTRGDVDDFIFAGELWSPSER